MTGGQVAVYHGTGWYFSNSALCLFEIPSESPIETYQATLMDLLDGENACACKPLDGNMHRTTAVIDDGERRRLLSFENEESMQFKGESKNSRRKKQECPVRMPCDT